MARTKAAWREGAEELVPRGVAYPPRFGSPAALGIRAKTTFCLTDIRDKARVGEARERLFGEARP